MARGSLVARDRNDPKTRDEACLTVTVWSPDISASLPVRVWIPGGAFLNGAGQLQLYAGARLAANGNVVVVSVTYRVGVFGGFELGSLGDGFDDNLFLRDQIAALAWVRDNIAAFGGDPDRVTPFGESAGATSVLALLASPAAGGLFARAIAQSPALPLIADRETRAEQAQRLLDELGVGPGELKGLPQRELRRAARPTPGIHGGVRWRRSVPTRCSSRVVRTLLTPIADTRRRTSIDSTTPRRRFESPVSARCTEARLCTFSNL